MNSDHIEAIIKRYDPNLEKLKGTAKPVIAERVRSIGYHNHRDAAIDKGELTVRTQADVNKRAGQFGRECLAAWEKRYHPL